MRRLQLLLIDYLAETDSPSVLQAKSSSDPTRMLLGIIGKTRLATASKYLRIWTAYRTWLLEHTGMAWPTKIFHLLDYVYVLSDMPCGPSVPQKFMQACR